MSEHVSGIDLVCDSCKKSIPAGEYHRKVRAKDSRPKTKRQAINAKHLRVKYNARHVDCPPPVYQVTCPRCFALPGDPCIDVLTIGINVGKTLNSPHKVRVRERKIQFNE